jgi:adenosylcobinamide-GDP ribazoletransferase
MGIGNTTSAAALMHKLTGLAAAECVGAGTGLSPEGVLRKQRVIEAANERHAGVTEPLEVLATFGGFEIAMMTGAMLQAAALRKTLLIDGFIVSAALLVASRIAPAILDYCVFAHCSDEAGHRRMLEQLGARPAAPAGHAPGRRHRRRARAAAAARGRQLPERDGDLRFRQRQRKVRNRIGDKTKMQQVRLFFIALQFFTRLPIPAWVGFEASWLQHASRYFPLVGCVVAAVAAAVYFAAALVLPAPVAAVLSTAASIYLTGAFHEDGFADACDGLGGGMTRERALEIMKDSRVGAYGAIGIVCMLAAKLSALAMLPPRVAVGALFLAHPLSRLAAASLIWKLDYVRDEGKAKPLAQQMTAAEFAIAALTALLPAPALLAAGWISPAAVLARCWPH